MVASQSSKKGQVQMMETIMVLVVFIIILIVGMVFFWGVVMKDIGASAKELEEEKYYVLTSILPTLPELLYSEATNEEEYIDTSKILAFQKTIADQTSHYSQLFGQTRISIEQTYPKPATIKECTLREFTNTDYPDNCNSWILYNKLTTRITRKITMPVSLYFPSSNQWRIGRLIVEYA